MTGSVVPIFTSTEEKLNKSHILNSSKILLHLIEDRTNEFNPSISQHNLQTSLNSHKKSVPCGLRYLRTVIQVHMVWVFKKQISLTAALLPSGVSIKSFNCFLYCISQKKKGKLISIALTGKSKRNPITKFENTNINQLANGGTRFSRNKKPN